MVQVDLLLKNCKIVSAEKIIEANISVEAGKIHSIVKAGHLPKAEQAVDIGGKLVLPGVIDPHVHFREPGKTWKEDFETGTLSAAFGGVTTVLDMPNNKPDIDSAIALKLKRKEIAKKAYVDYGLYAEVNNKNADKIDNIHALAYKAYLDSSIDYARLQTALNKLEEKIICIHPEDPEIIREKPERPLEAELTAVKHILGLDFGETQVHLSHCTSPKSIDLQEHSGKHLTFEANVHCLFLDRSYLGKLGSLVKIKPPLRDKIEVEGLWNNLSRIDCLSTDHSPHTLEEKQSENPPTGFPGVETFLPLMVNAVNENKLTWEELARLTAKGSSEIFGLKNKGSIEVGKDADLVVIDRKKDWTIKAENLHSKCGWTPYDNWQLKGSIEKVFLRGALIIESGEVMGKKGFGGEIK